MQGEATLTRFYVLRTVGSLANQLLQFAVPILVYTSTGSVAWSGIALFVEWIPRLASLPVAGPLVDRYGIRRVYAVTNGFRCAAVTLTAGAMLGAPATRQWALIMLAVVAGACFEQTFVAEEKAVRVLNPPGTMHKAQSVLGGIDQCMLVGGPALGGLLLVVSDASVVLVTAGLFLVSFVLIWRMSESPSVASTQPDQQGQQAGRDPATASDIHAWRIRTSDLARRLWEGTRRVMRNPILRTVVLVTILVNLLVGTILAASPAMVVEHFGLPDSALGLVYTTAGIASLLTLAAAPWLIRVFGLLRIGVVTALGACALATSLGVAPFFAAYAALVATFMCAESLFTVVIRTVRARVVPEAEFGSTVGIIVLLNFVSIPIAGLLVAASEFGLSLSWLFVVVGTGTLLGTAVLCRHLSHLMPQTRGRDGRWLIVALGDVDTADGTEGVDGAEHDTRDISSDKAPDISGRGRRATNAGRDESARSESE